MPGVTSTIIKAPEKGGNVLLIFFVLFIGYLYLSQKLDKVISAIRGEPLTPDNKPLGVMPVQPPNTQEPMFQVDVPYPVSPMGPYRKPERITVTAATCKSLVTNKLIEHGFSPKQASYFQVFICQDLGVLPPAMMMSNA